MNRINFYSGDKFPMYRQALAKMQDMIQLVSLLSGIGGKNFILSGCEFTEGSTTDGYIVIDGELMPFKGGVTKSRIEVVETRQNETAFNVTYPEVYITRFAQFSNTGDLNWKDFEPIKSNVEIYKAISDLVGDSPGVIKEFAGDPGSVPDGYMLCDGRDLAIDEYPDLYRAIGVRFGGDGIKSFKLPDTTGRFSVGYGGSSDYARVGNTGGSEHVTLTVDQMPSHAHSIGFTDEKWGDNANTRPYPNANSSSSYSAVTKSTGGSAAHENRPPYIVFAKIIKVK